MPKRSRPLRQLAIRKSLDAARVRYLGKSGEISRLSEGMREVAKRIDRGLENS